MERIKITDGRLAVQVNRIVEKLWEYYPDGTVYSLDKSHKGLSNRIGATWPAIGYATRNDFLTAYGFTVKCPQGANKSKPGGRPAVATAEAAEGLFKELLDRYDGREKPDTYNILLQDNPDLAGRMKSFSNKSKVLFGTTWTKVLQNRGVLAKSSTGTAVENALDRKDEFETMLDDLRGRYGDTPKKPKSIRALKREHPEYAELFDLLAKVSERLYGATIAQHLRDIGVLSAKPPTLSPEDAEAILDELVSRFGQRADNDKPSSWDDLLAGVDDITEEVRSARQTWDKTNEGTFIDELKSRGVMKRSVAGQRRVFVRNASTVDLVKIWRQASGPSRVDTHGELANWLPIGIAAIDFDECLQLEETMLCLTTSDCPDELLAAPLPRDLRYSAEEYKLLIKTPSGKTLLEKDVPVTDEFKAIERAANTYETGHSLKARVHAEIASVSPLSPDLLEGCNPALVQVRLFRATPLKAQVMLYVLCKAGLITADDLRASDEWRNRDYATMPIRSRADASPNEPGGMKNSAAVREPAVTVNHEAAKETGGAKQESAQPSKKDDIGFCMPCSDTKPGHLGFGIHMSSK